MAQVSARALFRALGVPATDAEGNLHRVVVGEMQDGTRVDAYALVSAQAVPDGTMLTIPGLTGMWRVSRPQPPGLDGLHRASISR